MGRQWDGRSVLDKNLRMEDRGTERGRVRLKYNGTWSEEEEEDKMCSYVMHYNKW